MANCILCRDARSKMELVWELPNHAASIGTRTINIDLSKYAAIFIVGRGSYNSVYYETRLYPKMSTTYRMAFADTDNSSRALQLTWSESGVKILMASENVTVDYIYGIKL